MVSGRSVFLLSRKLVDVYNLWFYVEAAAAELVGAFLDGAFTAFTQTDEDGF